MRYIIQILLLLLLVNCKKNKLKPDDYNFNINGTSGYGAYNETDSYLLKIIHTDSKYIITNNNDTLIKNKNRVSGKIKTSISTLGQTSGRSFYINGTLKLKGLHYLIEGDYTGDSYYGGTSGSGSSPNSLKGTFTIIKIVKK